MNKVLKQKMYGLVLRQLNPIQKGIQVTHAVVEFANTYFSDDEYKQWSKEDKTLVMLDMNDIPHMKSIIQKLVSVGIKFSCFCEPNLEGLPTALCFLADERVWDKYGHNDFIFPCYDSAMMFGETLIEDEWDAQKITTLRGILEHLRPSR